jgi:crotonobetainyl-CoA:carnitine CoA-transferase CaiB-like acyl-CoA transferase
MNIAASGDSMFTRLCNTIGAPQLLEDPEFKTGRDRSRNRKRLHEELSARFKDRSTDDWVDALNQAGVPCGPIYSIDQTFADPQVKHLGMARPVKHPRLGDIEVVGQAVNLEGEGGKPSVRSPSPDRGQHTKEVLKSLGYDDAAIGKLKQAHAI